MDAGAACVAFGLAVFRIAFGGVVTGRLKLCQG